MYNYTTFFIDKIKAFALADVGLNAVLPQDNITKKQNPESAVFPSVVVQTIENNPVSHTFTQEAMTNAGVQIDISCMDMLIGGVFTSASDACDYISMKIADYLEYDLRLARITSTDPIVIDIENHVFSCFLRYRIKHDLLNNLISK